MDLWDALTRETYNRGELHCWDGARFASARWSEVVADARRLAAGLQGLGVGPGSRVATVLSNSPHAVRGVLGVWLAGGALASFPVPARGMDFGEYREQLQALARHVQPCAFVVDEQLRAVAPPLADSVALASWESLYRASPLDPMPPSPDELAFVQYSSGSTGTPKGCMLSARAIAAQLEIIRAMLDGEPGRETVCSWLPLSHDMGLFGCLLYAWAWDYDLVLSTPDRFIASPRTWFADMAQSGCTQSAGTSSALHLATRAQRSAGLPGELQLRSLVIGAERIEAQTLESAAATFAAAGLQPTALRPAYGLAEATLAVTATATQVAPHAFAVDPVALADGVVTHAESGDDAATMLISLGRPCPGVELRFPEPQRVSELHVRSPSLFDGYYADSDQTRERLQDGELATRDLGFMRAGELFLVGRSDDVLSVAGRNVYTREIEAAVSGFAGVRSGCCTIVDVPENGASRLAMLLELRDGHDRFEEIAAAAARTAIAKAGIDLSECIFLERGALPKTPTGKVQRYRCRELLLHERLTMVRRVRTGSRARVATTSRAEATTNA